MLSFLLSSLPLSLSPSLSCPLSLSLLLSFYVVSGDLPTLIYVVFTVYNIYIYIYMDIYIYLYARGVGGCSGGEDRRLDQCHPGNHPEEAKGGSQCGQGHPTTLNNPNNRLYPYDSLPPFRLSFRLSLHSRIYSSWTRALLWDICMCVS